MTIKERWTASRQRNADAVATQADRIMANTRYDRLRTRGARIALVVGYLTCLALTAVSYLVIGSLAGVSVRTIADLPEDYLDERQAALRNAAYVEAYRWLGGFVGLLGSAALIAFIVLGQDPDTWSVSITWNAAMALFWVCLGLVLALPSLVLALHPRV